MTIAEKVQDQLREARAHLRNARHTASDRRALDSSDCASKEEAHELRGAIDHLAHGIEYLLDQRRVELLDRLKVTVEGSEINTIQRHDGKLAIELPEQFGGFLVLIEDRGENLDVQRFARGGYVGETPSAPALSFNMEAPVKTFSDLPLDGNTIYDVRFVEETNDNFWWTGEEWAVASPIAQSDLDKASALVSTGDR